MQKRSYSGRNVSLSALIDTIRGVSRYGGAPIWMLVSNLVLGSGYVEPVAIVVVQNDMTPMSHTTSASGVRPIAVTTSIGKRVAFPDRPA
jgi:hypothetical protein